VVRLRSIRVAGRTLLTRNGLLGRAPGVDGVKTGTLDGNWSMVASAHGRGGRVYAAVLGAPGPEARDRDAHCLLSIRRRLLATRAADQAR
jgi:D-alanyl-D-alanine carboxypeptidase